MLKYLYILIICYNLNLFLNIYIDMALKVITLFNYKNVNANEIVAFYDIVIYRIYFNKNLTSLTLSLA